ncbi:MAG TPA: aminotransferase class V-fold PLP-dependent enzyme [Usitatibacter sp.]|nr:aminotransferase class V-fold PLP-dependent enzyme [Usitatibacter sp.]
MKIPSQRHLFDVPRHVAYFNCASSTPQLNAAREGLGASVAARSRPWARTAADYFTDAEAIRRLSAEAIGGDAEGFAIVPAASYALASAARALEPRLQPGDGIVMMAEEFPSMVLAFRRVASERGAAIVTVPIPADGDWTTAIRSSIRAGVKVVAISSCHWTNGARVDLARIAEACRAVGAALVVDGTQTVGAMPFDFEAIAPDFLAVAGYKWMLGTYGVGLLHVAPKWRDARPLEESWLARQGAEDFAALVRPSNEYQPGARRFDVGEKGTALLPAAIAGLEQLREWGVASIAETLAEVNARIAEALAALGFRVAPPALRCPHMFGAEIPEGFGGDVVAALRAEDIYISRRGRSLRFSPHLHVDDADVERLVATLRSLLGRK